VTKREAVAARLSSYSLKVKEVVKCPWQIATWHSGRANHCSQPIAPGGKSRTLQPPQMMEQNTTSILIHHLRKLL